MSDESYNELLKSQEWQDKRREILKRDTYSCQRCGKGNNDVELNSINFEVFGNDTKMELFVNSSFLNTNVVKLITNGKDFLYVKSNKDGMFSMNAYNIFVGVNFVYKNKITYDFNGTTIDYINHNVFIKLNINIEAIDRFIKILSSKLDFNEIEIDKEGFFLFQKEDKNEYTKNSHLNIHHRCYRKSFDIWDQPDEDYITLCNVCHKIIHSNQLIPFYNEKGHIYQFMKPCPRCNGYKRFEQYKKIQNGICFQCNGLGYII